MSAIEKLLLSILGNASEEFLLELALLIGQKLNPPPAPVAAASESGAHI